MTVTNMASQLDAAENFQFDVRDDEEQFVKLQDTIDLLVAAGYFRARIKDLSPFDKVVGGIVWCITLCNRSVDVDLFYSENSTIGQKIALTERIVSVLGEMECPHAIEPHQVQGLDFLHIFPVIQWLVKKAIEENERHGNFVKAHSIYQFNNRFSFPHDFQKEEEKAKAIERYRYAKSNCAPRRFYKRRDDYRCKDLNEDIVVTLMEYENRKKGKESINRKSADARKSLTKDAGEERKGHLTEKETSLEQLRLQDNKESKLMEKGLHEDALRALSETSGLSDAELSPKVQYLIAERELGELRETLNFLQAELDSLKRTESKIYAEIASISGPLQQYKELLERSDEKKIEELLKMLREHDEIKQREKKFKTDCNEEIRRMNEELSVLLENDVQTENEETLEEEVKEAEERLASVRLEDASLNSQLALLYREVDDIPPRVEIIQYQRRIIELYNQMSSKHRETKQLYTLHNTLLDIEAYMKRELSLFNNISDIQELTSKEGYKESFMENLQEILKGVDASLDKATNRKEELQLKRDKISDDYQYLLEKERLYHKTVDDFKDECQKNEELNKKLQELSQKRNS
ncbi:hypothetical protein AB6A40_002336 [Gnathostoma spinigerum]|uniref:Coiled-coil domain-containing protein 93 n=1 Tax=Gnathostoma spinigerum TaxID=75299 RepID=A0ABD6E8K3_9BILA